MWLEDENDGPGMARELISSRGLVAKSRLAVYFQLLALVPIVLVARCEQLGYARFLETAGSGIPGKGFFFALLSLTSCFMPVLILVSLLVEHPRERWSWAASPCRLVSTSSRSWRSCLRCRSSKWGCLRSREEVSDPCPNDASFSGGLDIDGVGRPGFGPESTAARPPDVARSPAPDRSLYASANAKTASVDPTAPYPRREMIPKCGQSSENLRRVPIQSPGRGTPRSTDDSAKP